MEEVKISAEDMRYSMRAIALMPPEEARGLTSDATIKYTEEFAERLGGMPTLVETIRKMLKSRAKSKTYSENQYFNYSTIITTLRAMGHDLYSGKIWT